MVFASRSFFGASAGQVRLSARSVSATDLDVSAPYNAFASAGVRLRATGQLDVQQTEGGAAVYTPISGEWLVAGLAGDFEVLAQVSGDALSSGTTDVWLAMSGDREWALDMSRTTLGTSSASTSLQLSLREISTGVVYATATFNLSATAIADV